MKIEHINSEVTDTDKLPDIDAQILELSEQLRQICEANHRPVILLVDPSGYSKYSSFWNVSGRNNINKKGINITPMLSALNDIVVHLTQGGMSIQPKETDSPY